MNQPINIPREVARLLRMKSSSVKDALSSIGDETAVSYLAELFRGDGWTVAFHTGRKRSLLLSDPQRPDNIVLIVKLIVKDKAVTFDEARHELIDFENNLSYLYNCSQFSLIAMNGFEPHAGRLEAHNLLLEDWGYIENLIGHYSKDRKREPRIQLFAHNKQTYKKVKKMMDGGTKGVAVVQATGTGKSYLIARLLQDFAGEQRLVMAPSYYIINQIKEHIRWETDLPGEAGKIEFMTYAKSMNLSAEEIRALKPKMIVLDEFHRCGAEEWGRGVQDILNTYPNAFKFGTSATPIRYLDNGRDMSMELFNGHVAENLSLAQAITRNILPMPKYVCALYTLSEEISSMRHRIAGSRRNEATKRKLLMELDTYHIDWERSHGIPHVLKKHLASKRRVSGAEPRKFIIFCKDEAHLNEMEPMVKKWFKEAIDGVSIKTYRVHSKEAESDEQLEAFKNDLSKDHLHLLFSIDMLNEGLHVNEVNGVVLLRPTESPNIFYQQIGRCLKVGMNDRPVIFDFVNNFKSIRTHDFIYDLDMARNDLFTQRSEEGLQDRCPSFDVEDEVREIMEVFGEIKFKLDNWPDMYERLVEFKKQYKHTNVVYVPEQDNTLYEWLRWQRKRHYHHKLEQDQLEKLLALGVDLSYTPIGRAEDRWQQQYQNLSAFYQQHGHCNVPYHKKGDTTLFEWIRTQRKRNYEGKIPETQFEMLNSMGFDWTYQTTGSLADRWQEQYNALCDYKNQHGHLEIPKKDKLKALNQWAIRQRSKYKEGSLPDDKIKKLEAIGFSFIIDEWQDKYEDLVAYKHQHGHTAVTPKENKLLNYWLNSQRESYRLNKMDAGRSKLLNDLGFSWNRRDTIFERKHAPVELFYQQHGHLKFKPQTSLYSWAINLRNRYKKGWLTPAQIERLKTMNFNFEIQEHNAVTKEKYMQQVQDFYKTHGHINLPNTSEFKKLNQWFHGNRQKRREGSLSPDVTALLDSMGMAWEKNQKKDTWNAMYEKLEAYHRQTGTTFIEADDKINGELQRWCGRQRAARNQPAMTTERKDKLEMLGFAWSNEEGLWEYRFSQLRAFKNRYGHCRVSAADKPDYVQFAKNELRLPHPVSLYIWADKQRKEFAKKQLTPQQVEKLKSIGFDFTIKTGYAKVKDKRLEAMQRFHDIYGHCNVTDRHKDFPGLAKWLMSIKSQNKAGTLSIETFTRLSDLGVNWVMEMDILWNNKYEQLAAYRQKAGSCDITPTLNQELYTWCYNQKKLKKQGKLENQKIVMLDKLGFQW